MALRKKKAKKAAEPAAEPAGSETEATESANVVPGPSRSSQTEERLTESERRIMERFFGLGPRYPEWPVTALQRRMQSSRG